MRMPELWRQVWTAACSASVRGAGVAVAVSVSPRVTKVAVWVGTVPVWCSTSWVSPAVAEATPGTFTVAVSASAGKLSSVEERKKSWVNLVPAGPSFERSVVTLLFSASSAFASLAFALLRLTPAPPPPPGLALKKPPPLLFWGPLLVAVDVATRVTRMSVPMDDSGCRTAVWASLNPWERPMIPRTRPTPTARPRAVTRVRPHRRRSSWSRYPRWNIEPPGA